VPKPARRSHADRTAETRRRVTAAVVESIAEVGYQRTTGSEIARRAGVTWGAVQHHFGDKSGILAAVLEQSFERLATALGSPEDSDAPLEARVSDFVSRAWSHFRSDDYRTTFEILLNLPAEMEASWSQGVLDTWQTIWRESFPESPLTKQETADLMHYAVSVLSGLATTTILGGQAARASRSLSFLEDTLVEKLTR
jgi:AcrR family transcriptional regulator